MNASIEVLSPGLLTTVQDLGRWGYQAFGVAVAGPMDPFAHRRANALAGNPRSFATLEVTIVGPTLRFEDSRVIAVTGAEFDLFLDEQRIPAETPLAVRPGSELRFGARRRGGRAYVAVAGGIDTAPVLGSRATHLPTAIGGFEGRALRRGDRIPLGRPSSASRPPRSVRATAVSNDLFTAVRVMAGPQAERFAPDALELFLSAPYHVGVQSDRMGYRLSGPRLRHAAGADIISDATPLGSVQVPASGQPLLLMADHQTAGGYAKLATVISADIGVVGQACPGDRLRFQLCTRAEAIGALVARERPLLAIEPSEAR